MTEVESAEWARRAKEYDELEDISPEDGGEMTIAAMDYYHRIEIGRKTYNFVRRMMRNPEYRDRIQARAAEIRASREAALAMKDDMWRPATAINT